MTSELLLDRITAALAAAYVGDGAGQHGLTLTSGEVLSADPEALWPEQISVGERTRLRMLVAEELVRQGGRVTAAGIATGLVRWGRMHGLPDESRIGPSTHRAIQKLIDGVDPYETGKGGMTSGAAVKIVPVGLVFAGAPIADIVEQVVKVCTPSHGTSVAIAGAAAVACGVACAAADPVNVQAVVRAAIKGAELGVEHGVQVEAPSVAARLQQVLDTVVAGGDSDQLLAQLCEEIGCSEAAAEAVPLGFGCFLLADGRADEGLRLINRLPGAEDAVGAIAGALCGAYTGLAGIPDDWMERSRACTDLHLEEMSRELLACRNG